MLSRIVLRDGEMTVDLLQKSICHFKQLRSLELYDAILMSDLSLLEVLGTLPSLENFTLRTNDPYPAYAPENSSSQTGGSKYFGALESLCVTGSFFLIQHLLGFIDSLFLKSIEICTVINPVRNEHAFENIFIPSMTIIASKWSKSLTNLFIGTRGVALHHNAISKCLMLLMDLHAMQSFHLKGWWIENMDDDDLRRLVLSWPKLRVLNLKETIFSLSALKIFAENCPELRYLRILLDISTFPPFDASSKRLSSHKLEVLKVAGIRPSDTITQTSMECQIQVTKHLDLIFPYLQSLEVWDKTWSKLEYMRPDKVLPSYVAGGQVEY